MTLTLLELLGCNGVIGVFAAGLAFNWGMADRDEITNERVQEMTERLFLIPAFLLFGIMLPWQEFVGAARRQGKGSPSHDRMSRRG